MHGDAGLVASCSERETAGATIGRKPARRSAALADHPASIRDPRTPGCAPRRELICIHNAGVPKTQTRTPHAATPVPLTSLSHGTGCGCKLPAAALLPIVRGLPTVDEPRLLVGSNTADDAAVLKLTDEIALVMTICLLYTSPSPRDS